MTATKTRIYDITRIVTSSEQDQKIRKQKQADLAKHIISICESLGHPVKSASSSIDESLIGEVINLLKDKGFKIDPETLTNELKTKPAKSSGSQKVPEELKEPPQPVKKQLKIIRRIKPAQQLLEAALQESQASLAASAETPLTNAEVKNSVLPAKPQEPFTRIAQTEEKRVTSHEHITEPLRRVFKTSPVPPSPPTKMQPFRVAKPTMAPSMMGRTKRPSIKRGSHKEKREKEPEITETITKPASVVITSALTVKELAEKLLLPETEVIKSLFSRGTIKTVNQTVELDVAVQCARSLNYEVITEVEKEKEEKTLQIDISHEEEANLEPRPPVVTIMGHVDHGKTSLLDAIRETKLKLTDKEAGGITQHIGAYQVEVLDYDGNKRKISFLDTPGHEAFTAMRARGAQVTDIAVLVVAADDGVMPQTIEAIDHAKAAGVPIVIAVNKIDKPGAQPDKVLGQLVEHDLLVEDYGGKTVCSKISAKKRLNLDDLLTKITLVADAELANKLRANPNSPATGAVIEAQLSKEKGSLAHLLVLNGTLRKGDCIVAGTVAGRVRAMFNDHNVEIEEAPPSTPVEVLGLADIPKAGDIFQAYSSYQKAKEIASERLLKDQEKHKKLGLYDFAAKVKEGQIHELKIIIKADVQGSAEAVAKEIINLSTKDVLVRLVHVGSGNISENDINLAASTDAIVIGFHVSADQNAQKAAIDEGVDVRIYDIIYKITEDLEKAVLGLLEPEREEVKLGAVEVRQIFTYGKGNKIAGCYVTEGKVQRKEIGKLMRNNKVIYTGKIDSLKRFKDDAREVQTGFECGISFEGFNDIEEGDKIECYTIVEKQRTSL